MFQQTTAIVRPIYPETADVCCVAYGAGHGDDAFIGLAQMTNEDTDWGVDLDRDQALALVDGLQQAIRRVWGENPA